MAKYLDPPHIQLGFYWHKLPEVEAYQMLLRWLVEHGYKLTSAVTMRSRDGRLPRFNQLVTHNLPDSDVRTVGDAEVGQILTSQDWLPVRTRLVPTNDRNVEIDLGYALLHDGPFMQGEHHAVEIVASDADLNLLENVGADNMKPKALRHARRTDKWYKMIFKVVCESLSPCYASRAWEWDLQPPTYMRDEGDYGDFRDLYFSNTVLSSAKIVSEMAKLSEWSIERYSNGVLFCHTARRFDAGLDQANRGVQLIRKVFQESFRGHSH